MRFDPTRCAHCGGPPVAAGRMWPDAPFFFCSDNCYDRELNRHIPVELSVGKGIEQDPEYKRLNNNYEEMRRRFYPPDRLYSEERKAKQTKFDVEEQAIIREYVAEWQQRKIRAANDADEQIKLIWYAHQHDIETKREEEARVEREGRDAEQAALLEKVAARPIPDGLRYEHTHILGPSGSGKTTLLQDIILRNPKDAYLILDPKGTDLFEPLARCAEFSSRLILIDPFETPALPLFSANDPAEAASNFSYIFSTAGQKLTGHQQSCFTFCIALLFQVPNAKLFTLLDLLDDNEKRRDPRFIEALRHTDDFTRRFFEHDYYSSTYSSTKELIKARVYGVARNSHLRAMFDAPKATFDIFAALQNGGIVIVNTRMAQLGDEHQILGRFLISQFFDAIMARAAIDRSRWNPAFLVVDEAQEFIDAEKVPRMLRLMRSFNAGAILAHHNMYNDVFDESIRAAISTNTGIKLCSDPRGSDINYMARDLRCEPEFLTTQARKNATHARFACLFSGLDHPFIHETPWRHINRRPLLSDTEYDRLREKNRTQLAADISLPDPPAVQPPPSSPVVQAPTRPTPLPRQSPQSETDTEDHTKPVKGW